MKYITGNEIETSKVAFTTARGAKVELVLIKNARLADNGWLPAETHTVELLVNGGEQNFQGAREEAEYGYCLTFGMGGRNVIPVPAESLDAVKALLAERDDNNERADRESNAADSRYEAHSAAVNKLLNQ